MNSHRKTIRTVLITARRSMIMAFSLLTIHYSLFTAASAQDDPPDLAPPPLRIVSREDLARLAAEDDDIKGRTKLVLEMMNARLGAAEKLNNSENFDGMFQEMGYFHALMENALTFLEARNKSAGKVLDNYKRFEIGLRAFVPRLETVRRTVPIRYEDYLRKLIKFVRDARTRATEPLFGDSVVRKPEGR